MLGFCNESLRGNRICDEINNHQDCEYDWGDCCRPVVQCPSIKTEFNETFFVNETICSNVTANSPLVPANSSIVPSLNTSMLTAMGNDSKDDANCTTVLVESYNITEVYIEGNCSTCHQTKVVHKTYKGKLLIATST